MRAVSLFLVALFLAAAAVPSFEAGTEEPATLQVPTEPTAEEVARGQQVYELVCAGCHTLDPPPDSAPPMRHVARHLRTDLDSFEAFAEHVRTYVPAPNAERSRLPAMAIERFGLMDPLPLTEDVLNSAAAYLWSLTASTGEAGCGMMCGEGPMGRGMRRDTTAGG